MVFKNIWHLLKPAFSDVYSREDFYHWWTLVSIPPWIHFELYLFSTTADEALQFFFSDYVTKENTQ